MSPLCDRMMSLDSTLQIHNEGEWSKTLSTYSAWNSGGVECEVGEFLYGFLRMTKPEYVLETGTHLAIGASFMGFALKDNFRGHLDTAEFIPEIHAQAVERIHKMGLDDYVTCHFLDVKDMPVQHNYQFILLDTEPQTRFAEFLKFYPYLDEGGYMFIHDLGRGMNQNESPGLPFWGWPFGKIPEEMRQLMKDGKVRPFHFSTPRGLTGLYKVSKEDYKYD